MDIKFRAAKWQQDSNGELWLSLRVERGGELPVKRFVASMKEEIYAATLRQHRKRRSLDANAYLWVLCQKISETVGATKEEVYLASIRRVGQFEALPIHNDALETFISRWGEKGLGWYAEAVHKSKIPDYTVVFAYYGSSVYDSAEMSVLIEDVVSECKELGIETLTPGELDLLCREWGNAQENKGVQHTA